MLIKHGAGDLYGLHVLPNAESMIFYCRYIQSTCATSGEGLYEGLDWLSNNIANKVWERIIILDFICHFNLL